MTIITSEIFDDKKLLNLGLCSDNTELMNLLEENFNSEFSICTPSSLNESEMASFWEKNLPDLFVVCLNKIPGNLILNKIRDNLKLKQIPLLYIGTEVPADLLPPTYFLSLPFKKMDVVNSLKNMQYVSRLEKKYKDLQEKEIKFSKWTFLGRILSGIIHDINNPLTVVGLNLGIVSMLLERNAQKDESLEKANKCSLEIEKGLNQVNETLSKVRSFIIKKSGYMDLNLIVTTSMKDIIDDAINICQAEIRKRNIEMSINIAPGIETELILADKDKLTEVIIYLFFNLIESFDGSDNNQQHCIKVNSTLMVKENSEVLQICLSNNQLAGNSDEIGLSLVNKIIQAHQGRIFCQESTGEAGKEWVIQLPKSN